MIRSGASAEKFERGLAVGRFENLIAMRGKPHAQKLADRRLVVDDQDAKRRRAHAAASSFCGVARDRQRDREHGAAAVGAVAGDDGAVHGLDEAARNGKPEAGAGPHLIGLLHAIELIENVLEVGRRNAFALVEDLQATPWCGRARCG